MGAGRTHLRERQGRFLGIKEKGTAGQHELLRKESGAPNSHFSPKSRETLPLHLMEMCICTPGRKLRPVNHSVVRKVSSAHKFRLLSQGCNVPYERLRRTPVRGKNPGSVPSLERLADQRSNSDPK